MSWRRIAPANAAAIAVVLGTTTPATAQGVDEFGPYGGLEDSSRLQSPQHMAVELRVGPYFPRIDDSTSGTPYADIFGDKQRFLVGAEFDYQVLRIPAVGSLGPGVGIGTFSAKAKAPLADGSGASGEETRLRVLPAHLVAVLRVDVLAQRTKVPLAAYAKGGLGYALWWARGEQHLERADGVVGKGSSYGYHLAVGGMFLLDSLDRNSALEMDATTGINSVYAFGEFVTTSLDGFGSDRLNVGATTWMAGIVLEF